MSDSRVAPVVAGGGWPLTWPVQLQLASWCLIAPALIGFLPAFVVLGVAALVGLRVAPISDVWEPLARSLLVTCGAGIAALVAPRIWRAASAYKWIVLVLVGLLPYALLPIVGTNRGPHNDDPSAINSREFVVEQGVDLALFGAGVGFNFLVLSWAAASRWGLARERP